MSDEDPEAFNVLVSDMVIDVVELGSLALEVVRAILLFVAAKVTVTEDRV